MFERYTESARRALFFARYEASMLGSVAIETHHLLLGLLKDPDPLITRVLAGTDLRGLLQQVYARSVTGTSPIALSVEIPFSRNVKHVLLYGLEEADRLLHDPIGPEHLLLGLLRLEQGIAWDILSESHIALTPVREALVMHFRATAPLPKVLKNLYFLKALDGSRPGRRPIMDDPTAGVSSSSSFVEFKTAADSPPDRRIQSIGPLSMHSVTLPQFARMLESFLNGPVIVDEDGAMSDMFDIELHGTYDNEDALIPALRDQLGLLLTKSV